MSRNKKNKSNFQIYLAIAVLLLILFSVFYLTKIATQDKAVDEKPADAKLADLTRDIDYAVDLKVNYVLSSANLFGLETAWEPVAPAGSSIFFWKNECKNYSNQTPGDFIGSYSAYPHTTYTHTTPLFKAGGKYCAQIWENYFIGKVASKPITLTIPQRKLDVNYTLNNGVYSIVARWDPPTGNIDESIFFWKGECRYYPKYEPGDLIWSYGTMNKSTYTHTGPYQPGNTYCVQIWSDFYKNIAGSNQVTVSIPASR